MKKTNLTGTLLLAAGILLQSSLLCVQSRGAAGDVDLSFDPGSGVNNQVRLIVPLPGGKNLIGGEFSTVRGLRRIGIARINPDGSGDATFDAGSAGGRYFTSLALESDGKILLGAADGLIRLDSDGGGETLINIPTYEKICYSWGLCAYGINTFAVQPDGKILIGGWFKTQNGAATNYGIARILPDGAIDSGFSATVAPPGEGNVLGEGVSAIDLLPDGKLVIAGFYSLVNGVPRPGIARLHSDGRLDESFNATGAISGNVSLVETLSDGKVLVAGPSFTNAGENPVIAQLNTNGSLDTGFHFDPSLLDSIWSVVAQPDGKILVAGFVNTAGWHGSKLIRLLPDGSLDQTFHAVATAGDAADVRGVAVQGDGTILIGGLINGAGEQRVNGLARLHPDGSLDSGFLTDTGLAGTQRPGVRSIAVQTDGKLLLGGSRLLAGPTAFGIVRLHSDGILDPAFSPPDKRDVVALTLQPDGKILIGEDLTLLEGPSRPAVSRLLPGGEPDISFRAELSDLPLPADCSPDAEQNGEICSESFSVTAVAALADGRILIAGFRTTVICDFVACWEIRRPFVARLNADGRHDDTFLLSQFGTTGGAFIQSIIVQPDGRILVAGYFKAVDDQARPGVARLNPDGSLDGSFAPGMPAASETVIATALTLQPDGRILFGKNIVNSGQIVRREIERLNPDGSIDASFNSGEGVNGSVYSILVQADGKLIIAGDFTRAAGAGHHRIARMHPDGSGDDTFHAGIGADAAVYTMASMGDDGVFIGGEFNSVAVLARPGVAKLHAEPGSTVPFGTWVARFGLAGPDAAAADADPDRDGMPNGVEYVLGGNPDHPATSGRPAVTVAGGSMIFTFLRDDASETPDVSLTVETGTDLLTWPNIFTVGPDTSTSSPGVTITENGDAPDTITVVIPFGTGKTGFARMKVTITP